jgi:hypothetical protein
VAPRNSKNTPSSERPGGVRKTMKKPKQVNPRPVIQSKRRRKKFPVTR